MQPLERFSAFNPVPSCTGVVLPSCHLQMMKVFDDGTFCKSHPVASAKQYMDHDQGKHYSTFLEASAPQVLAVLIPRFKDLVGGGTNTDWVTIRDLETTLWQLRFGNYDWVTNNHRLGN